MRWGDELDVRHLDAEARREVAGYLAKYATKSTEQAGGVLHRVAEHQVDELPVREHVRRYLRAAFTLAATPRSPTAGSARARTSSATAATASPRAAATRRRSRRCAQARERHVHEQILARSRDAAQRAIAGATERVASFQYAGQGHLTAADAFLAESAARASARAPPNGARGAVRPTTTRR